MSSYKNIFLIFALVRIAFFSLHKMVDSANSPDNYSTLKISITAIITSSEVLEIVSDHLKTKKMCKNAVKKSKFVIMYVFDQYKRQ